MQSIRSLPSLNPKPQALYFDGPRTDIRKKTSFYTAVECFSLKEVNALRAIALDLIASLAQTRESPRSPAFQASRIFSPLSATDNQVIGGCARLFQELLVYTKILPLFFSMLKSDELELLTCQVHSTLSEIGIETIQERWLCHQLRTGKKDCDYLFALTYLDIRFRGDVLFFRPRDLNELNTLVSNATKENNPVLILGLCLHKSHSIHDIYRNNPSSIDIEYKAPEGCGST